MTEPSGPDSRNPLLKLKLTKRDVVVAAGSGALFLWLGSVGGSMLQEIFDKSKIEELKKTIAELERGKKVDTGRVQMMKDTCNAWQRSLDAMRDKHKDQEGLINQCEAHLKTLQKRIEELSKN